MLSGFYLLLQMLPMLSGFYLLLQKLPMLSTILVNYVLAVEVVDYVRHTSKKKRSLIIHISTSENGWMNRWMDGWIYMCVHTA